MRRGFTLIELLIVIAILAVLAAVIFPVFSRAKAAAKKTACISNLSQIGKATMLYMADNDDLFPRALDASDKYAPEIWSSHPDWQQTIANTLMLNDALKEYTREPEIFRCPSDTGTRTLDNHFPIEFITSPSLFRQYRMSYFYRTELGFRGHSQTSIEEPASVNYVFDAAGHWHSTRPAITPGDSLDKYLEFIGDYRYNTLYADMHARNLTRARLDDAWSYGL